jgi:hypothetical protein
MSSPAARIPTNADDHKPIVISAAPRPVQSTEPEARSLLPAMTAV